MRAAFGLMQAIMIILILSTMLLITLKYASISSQHTADTYVKEQTALFLESAIEQTLLAISLHDRSGGCLASFAPEPVVKKGITYSAEVNIARYYLQADSQDLIDCAALGVSISQSASHAMVLLEVEAKAMKGTKVVSRILRRTLQQP